MTATTFSSADVQTRKAWSDFVEYDITNDTEIVSDARRMGIVRNFDDLSKGKGDQVKFHFLPRASGKGFIDDEAATGSEKALTYHQDTLDIHFFREVFQIPNEGISEQRVVFDMPDDVYETLRNWVQEKMIVGYLNQIAGNNASSITYDGETYSTASDLLKITAGNAVTAASTNQIIRANSLATDTLVAADTTATFNLGLILNAESRARKNRPYVRKIGMDGINYVTYLHTDGFLQMLNDTSSPFQFRDIYLNQLAGGKDSTTFDGTSFKFSETKIIVTDKVPQGVTSQTTDANSRRAIFCGKEAAAMAYGKGFSANGKTTPGFSFKEDTTDIEHWRRISITALYGLSKAQFNSVDRGTIAITHYVA